MKLNKENIKQICLIMTGILFIGVGYFNYSLDLKEKDDSQIARKNTNEINLGDVELVNANPTIEDVGMIVPNDELTQRNSSESLNKIENIEDRNVIETENIIKDNNYFQETRLEREKMYSEMIETYEELIKNEATPNDQKAIAAQEISNITNIKNGIMISENLIKNKGFEDVIILVNNDTASVVVKSYNLNQEQISKIQNIIQRELKIEIKNINISNKF